MKRAPTNWSLAGAERMLAAAPLGELLVCLDRGLEHIAHSEKARWVVALADQSLPASGRSVKSCECYTEDVILRRELDRGRFPEPVS